MTNEDYVGALVRFANGAQGMLEACRVINGSACDMSFEVHGTRGAPSVDFERMNELHLSLVGDEGARTGYTRIVSGPDHPFHAAFNPAYGTGLGYDDLKMIEAYQFARSIAEGRQGQPGFADALAVATVQQAVQRSSESLAGKTCSPCEAYTSEPVPPGLWPLCPGTRHGWPHRGACA